MSEFGFPKYPPVVFFSTESDSVVFCSSVVNLLRMVFHYSNIVNKSVQQNVVIQYIFTSESLRVLNSLQSSQFTMRIFMFYASWGPTFLGTLRTLTVKGARP